MAFTRTDKCPICSSRRFTKIFAGNQLASARFLALSRKKYQGAMDGWVREVSLDVLACDSCHHIWQAEFPDRKDLAAMYGSGTAIHAGKRLTEPSTRMLREMALLKKLVPSRPDGSRPKLLDYGAGFGLWSRAAVMVGFDVVAYEPSMERSLYPDEEVGFRCVNSLEEIAGISFDAINVEQVLEHVLDPQEVMVHIRNFAALGTIVRITVPNASGLLRNPKAMASFPFDGSSPHLLSPYEHLHGFTPRSLSRLLKQAHLVRHHGVFRFSPKQWLRMTIPNTFVIARVSG
jgi:hypothetical protein